MSDESIEKRYSVKDLKWSILLLFGCFCIGFNAAIAFHELGHAFAMVLDGVRIKEFFLNPLSWSWTFPKSLNHPLFTAFGGVSFGLLFAILPSILAIWNRSAYFRIPAFNTAAFAYLFNGIYLIAGTFFKIGDGGELIQYGVSHLLIIALGGSYLVVSLLLLALIQPLLGINKNFSISKRFLIFGTGIIPYLLMMFLYNLLMNKKEILLWFSFVLAWIFVILLVSFLGYFWARIQKGFGDINRSTVGWGPVKMALFIGFAIIMGELAVFGVKENPF